MKEAVRCLMCKNPQCVTNCPAEIDIPGFVGKIAEGEFRSGPHPAGPAPHCRRSADGFAPRAPSAS
jgi:Fe-S oxidoreductase